MSLLLLLLPAVDADAVKRSAVTLNLGLARQRLDNVTEAACAAVTVAAGENHSYTADRFLLAMHYYRRSIEAKASKRLGQAHKSSERRRQRLGPELCDDSTRLGLAVA